MSGFRTAREIPDVEKILIALIKHRVRQCVLSAARWRRLRDAGFSARALLCPVVPATTTLAPLKLAPRR
jgi:hypothetical protein